MRSEILWFGLALFCLPAMAKDPDCTGPDAWPASMAYTELKNAGLLDPDTLDFDKTEVVRLASQPGKPQGIYQQVHKVRFVDKQGKSLEVITNNEVSDEECSQGDVEVYVISRQLGAAAPTAPASIKPEENPPQEQQR